MDARAYQEQAKSNEAAAKVVKSRYPDWAVTMCFYAALHWVNYHAAKNGTTSFTRHNQRRDYVKDFSAETRNRNLQIAYEFLEKESKKSRYGEDVNVHPVSYYGWHTESLKAAFEKLELVRQFFGS
ncbi:MAG: hypothetical protein AAF609_14500 [Cyanobacteria bacterium P01_C01_bin.120]